MRNTLPNKLFSTLWKGRFKTFEWFKKNAWEDIDNEFWENEAQREHFNAGEKAEIPWSNEDLEPAIPNIVMGEVHTLSTSQIQSKMWGIEEIYNSVDDPEYFI